MFMEANDILADWQLNQDRELNFKNADEVEREAALKASMADWD